MIEVRLSERARKYLREVGSIVLGVLIALGIGEVADDLRWRVRAAASERAMNEELALAAGILDERALVQPCLERRLVEIKQQIDRAWQSGRLPDLAPFGAAPSRPFQTAAWADALASGTLPHLENRSRMMLSLNYPIITDYPKGVDEENDLWAAVHIIIDKPGPVPRSLLIDATAALNRLYLQNQRNGVNAAQIKLDLDRRGIEPNYFLVLDRRGTRSEVATGVQRALICQPLQRLVAARR